MPFASADSFVELLVRHRRGEADAFAELRRRGGRHVESYVGSLLQRWPLGPAGQVADGVWHWLRVFLRRCGEETFDTLRGVAAGEEADDALRESFALLTLWAHRALFARPEVLGEWLERKARDDGDAPVLLRDETTAEAGDDVTAFDAAARGLGYEVRVLHRSKLLFGGDWCFGRVDPAGTLWTILFDTCGHSFVSHAVKRCFLLTCEDVLEKTSADPLALFDELEQRLEEADCVPEDFFFEGTAATFRGDGRATLSAFGMGFVASRTPGLSAVYERLSHGPWLGAGLPIPRELQLRSLLPGDELAVLSDGFDEQPVADGRLGTRVETADSGAAALHDLLVTLLEAAFRNAEQQDDVSVISVRRLTATERRGG